MCENVVPATVTVHQVYKIRLNHRMKSSPYYGCHIKDLLKNNLTTLNLNGDLGNRKNLNHI